MHFLASGKIGGMLGLLGKFWEENGNPLFWSWCLGVGQTEHPVLGGCYVVYAMTWPVTKSVDSRVSKAHSLQSHGEEL